MIKRFCLRYGRTVLLSLLLIFSGLAIAHFASQYYLRQSLIEAVFTPPALVVKPSKAPPPPTSKPNTDSEPRGGSSTPMDSDVKVEVFGLLKFEMSESNSWQTIAKIMTVILGTFFGIRAINAVFRRIDDEDDQ